MGLIGRALEMDGIATVMVAWHGGRVAKLGAPRALITKLERGVAFGMPEDDVQQKMMLAAALNLLEQPSPIKPVLIGANDVTTEQH